MIDRQTVQIGYPEKGIQEFIPITFSQPHYSVLNLIVHTVLFDYKFRPSPLYYSQNEDFVKVITREEKGAIKPENMSLTIEDIIFPKGLSITKISSAYIGKLYDQFILPLINSIEMIKKRTEEVKMEEEYKIDSYEIERNNWISSVLKLTSTSELSISLMDQININANIIFQLWNDYLNLVINTSITKRLLEEFNKKRAQHFSQFVYQSEIKVKAFSYSTTRDTALEHQNLVSVIRHSLAKGIDKIPLKELSLFAKPDEIPILFENLSVKEDIVPRVLEEDVKDSLMAFVHGFQGSSFDGKMLKNVLMIRLPELQTLWSSANEKATEGDIQVLADKLAHEVITYICEWLPKGKLKKLSFFGHSLGGVIIRAALPKLREYKNNMHLFVTFSTPHLGYIYQDSKLVGAGMWVLKKWKSSKCLEQLQMTDDKKYTETFLYKLSLAEGIGWFKYVMLMSSFLDSYSPYESSRIEVYNKVTSKSSKEAVYIQMAANIISQIKANALYRINVAFNIKKTDINSLIGREAHLQFLENEALMKLFGYRYANLLAK